MNKDFIKRKIEQMKIEKVGKIVANLHDKEENFIQIRNLKKALKHGLIIKFNQKALLNSYIDMKTDLAKKINNEFEKDIFKLMSNIVFGKTMENVRKHTKISSL